MPNDQPINLTLLIDTGEGAEADEVDKMTRQLLRELKATVDAKSAELVTHEAPEGTLSAEAVTIGALALAVLPVFVDSVINFLIEWSKRGDGRIITIKTEMDGDPLEVAFDPNKTSPDELKQMIDILRSDK